MRYHKAILITLVEARWIMDRCSDALSEIVVISRGERYYDVRAMTQTEIDAFVEDLARAEFAELEAGKVRRN